MSKCPECRNEFVQPFVCTTCGAQKLHDSTMTSLHQRNERLTAELAEARELLRHLADVAHQEVSPEYSEHIDDAFCMVEAFLSPTKIQTLGKRELDYKELYLEARELLEKMCGLVEWWAPKDGMPRTAEARALLARTEGKA